MYSEILKKKKIKTKLFEKPREPILFQKFTNFCQSLVFKVAKKATNSYTKRKPF